jgi:chemotaxis protein CheY-P-specific phosphatase CheC
MLHGFTLLADGMRQASRRLGRMAKNRLYIRVMGGRVLSLAQVATDLSDADRDMCAVVVAITCEQPSKMEMRFVIGVDKDALYPLASAIAGEVLVDDPRMATSVLQELGNIGASAISNHLASHFGSAVHVSAPDVVEDRWGAVASSIIGSFLDPADQMATLSTEFTLDGQHFSGAAFLVADRDVDLSGTLSSTISGGVR